MDRSNMEPSVRKLLDFKDLIVKHVKAMENETDTEVLVSSMNELTASMEIGQPILEEASNFVIKLYEEAQLLTKAS
jgi:hypothetical protein